MKKEVYLLLLLIIICTTTVSLGQVHNSILNGSLGANIFISKFPSVNFQGEINEESKSLIGFNLNLKSYLMEVSDNLFLTPSITVGYLHSSREDIIVTGYTKVGGYDGYNDIDAWKTGLNFDFNYIIKGEKRDYYLGAGVGLVYFGLKTVVFDGQYTSEFDDSGLKPLFNIIGGYQLSKDIDLEVRGNFGKDIKMLEANFNYNMLK